MKLPVNYHADITSKCAFMYKFMVISQNANYKKWLINHINLRFQWDDNAFYDIENEFTLKSFSDILEFEKQSFFEFTCDALIEKCVDLISKGEYILLDENYATLFNTKVAFHLHEIFLYGYDKEKQIFYSACLDNNRQWIECEIPFSLLVKSHNETILFYKQPQNQLELKKREQYNYPFMSFHNKADNDYVVNELLLKKHIDEISSGFRHVAEWYDYQGDTINCCAYCWTGVSIFMGIRERLPILTQNHSSYAITKLFSTLYEYVKILKIKTEYIIMHYDLLGENKYLVLNYFEKVIYDLKNHSDNRICSTAEVIFLQGYCKNGLKNVENEMENSVNNIQLCLNLCIKNEITRDENNLQKISDILKNTYDTQNLYYRCLSYVLEKII